jgi:hypothetical protein
MKLKFVGLSLLAVVIAFAAVFGMAGVARAQGGGVVITTPPFKENAPFWIDWDGDGISEDAEYVGEFDVYDWNYDIDFVWAPYSFAAGSNGSYRIAAVPYGCTDWAYDAEGNTIDCNLFELFYDYSSKIAHHWAENPNGTKFTYGAWGWGEPVYSSAIYAITVQPETYVKFYDPTTDSYEYEYTLVPGAPMQQSELFGFELTPWSP